MHLVEQEVEQEVDLLSQPDSDVAPPLLQWYLDIMVL